MRGVRDGTERLRQKRENLGGSMMSGRGGYEMVGIYVSEYKFFGFWMRS